MKKILLVLVFLSLSVNCFARQTAKDLDDYSIKIQDYANNDICSGVILNTEEGQSAILTAKHCVQQGMQVESFPVILVIKDHNSDLAVLYIGTKLNKKKIRLANNLPKLGELIYIYGYPSGKSTFSMGKIINYLDKSVVKDQDNVYSVIPQISSTSINIKSGNSGGGVFNQKGELIGIAIVSSQKENWGGFVNLLDILIFLKAI